MEFNEKLQQLRRQKGLTQEELAEKLYVSRTAVSKWESGRGLPNIDSLKAIAVYFSVTVDQLLSGEELLTLAQEDRSQKEAQLQDTVFGLLDCGMAMLLFLPFFGQDTGNGIRAVSLLALTGISHYLKTAYYSFVLGLSMLGILTLALQNCRRAFWLRHKHGLSLLLGTAGVGLFILSRQAYGAAFAFLFLGIKALMLLKRR